MKLGNLCGILHKKTWSRNSNGTDRKLLPLPSDLADEDSPATILAMMKPAPEETTESPQSPSASYGEKYYRNRLEKVLTKEHYEQLREADWLDFQTRGDLIFKPALDAMIAEDVSLTEYGFEALEMMGKLPKFSPTWQELEGWWTVRFNHIDNMICLPGGLWCDYEKEKYTEACLKLGYNFQPSFETFTA